MMQLSNFNTPVPTSPLTVVPLLDPDAHYRSRTFHSEYGLNPLLTAAAPLLSLLSKLQSGAEISDQAADLSQQLLEEMQTFAYLAKQSDYHAETIMLARYLLATSLDDILGHTEHWPHVSAWSQHKLLPQLQHQDNGDERFFVIVENLLQDAKHHLHLLELCYLCLSLGYQGQYRKPENTASTRMQIIDKLYQTIQEHKGDFDKSLSSLSKPIIKNKKHSFKLRWLALGLVVLLAAIYLFSDFLFLQTTDPTYQTAKELTHHE